LLASAASQAVTEVRSAFFPNFFASVTGADAVENSRIAAGGLNNPIIYSRFGSGLTMSQLITDFGRTANLASSSRLHASAEAQNAEATREQVLLLVDRAFYSALRSQAVLRVAEQTVAARQLIVDQVTALAKSRLKSSLDVSFANVNLSDAKLLLLEAQNDMKAAFAELATAMGSRDQQSFALLDEPMPELLPSDVSPLINQAFRSRPELAGQQFQRDAAFKLAEAEKDLWRPSISTVTSVGVLPTHVDNLTGHYAAFGLNVNIPLFNGHLFSARRQEAELRAQAASSKVRDLENSIARDVRMAWLKANTGYQRLDLTAQLLDQAAQALDLAQARYDIGLSSIVELSQAQLSQTAAEIANVTARYDYQIQRAVLDFQAGTLR
jgi:outer membrane protein